MSATLPDLEDEVAAAGVAFGLLRLVDGDYQINLDFFSAPAEHVGAALSDPVQRDALLGAVDELLPPGTPAALNGSGRRYHPILRTASVGELYLTVERTGDPVDPLTAIGLAGEVQVPGGGPSFTADIPIVSALGTTVIPVAAKPDSPVNVDLKVPFGEDGGSLSVSLRLVAPPYESQTRFLVRLAPIGDDGKPLPPIEFDPLGEPGGIAEIAALLVQAAFAFLASSGPDELRPLGLHLPGLLGFGGGLPPFPFDRVLSDPAALRDWMRALTDTTAGGRPALVTWLDHLGQLLGAPAIPASRTTLPTESDPVVLPLFAGAPGFPAVTLTVGVRTAPGGDRLLVAGLRVDATATDIDAAVAGDAVLVALPLSGAAPAILAERVDLVARTPAGGGHLFESGDMVVGGASAGLRYQDGVVVPLIELREVTLDQAGYFPRLDLTNIDALSAAAKGALKNAVRKGLGPTEPFSPTAPLVDAVVTLIGLETDPGVDLSRLATAPTRALADYYRALRPRDRGWPDALRALWVLLGGDPDTEDLFDEQAGTVNDPWRLELTQFPGPDEARLAFSIALWDAAPVGAPTPKLRLGLHVEAENDDQHPTPAWTLSATSALLGFDLPAGGGGTVHWLGDQALSLTVSALPNAAAGELLALSVDRIAAWASWRPGSPLAAKVRVEDIEVSGGGETVDLGTLILTPPLHVDLSSPDLGLGVDVDALWAALRLLAARGLHSWLGDTGDVVAALLGLARPPGLGLAPDFPLLPLPQEDDLRSLVSDPLVALGAWMGRLFDPEHGLSAAGTPFFGALGTLGPRSDPFAIEIGSVGSTPVELLGWLDPEGPPLAWAEPVLERLDEGPVDAQTLVDAIADLSPYLGDRAAGLARADRADAAGALRALADALGAGDGVVPTAAALPPLAAWDHGSALAAEAHHLLPRAGAITADVRDRLDELTAGRGAETWAVVLVAPDLAGDDAWAPLLELVDPAAVVDVDLRTGPDPLQVDLGGVTAASHYVVHLADDGTPPLVAVAAQLERVVNRIRELKPGAKLAFVAHSYAGVVAQQQVADHPETALGLVAIGAPLAPVAAPGLSDAFEAEGVRLARRIAPDGLAHAPALDAALDHLSGALDGRAAAAAAFLRAPDPAPDLHGVPALALAGVVESALLDALARSVRSAVGLAGGGSVTHVGNALRVPCTLPDPRDGEPEVRASVRLDLGRARVGPGDEPAHAAHRLVFLVELGRADGWLIGGPGDGTAQELRVRSAEIELAVTPAQSALMAEFDARLYDAALLGVGAPVVSLRDSNGPALLGRLIEALDASALPDGQVGAIVGLLADLGLVTRGPEGAEVDLAALGGLVTDPLAYLKRRLPQLLDRSAGLLGFQRDPDAPPGAGPWRLALDPLPLEAVIEPVPWRMTVRTAGEGLEVPGGAFATVAATVVLEDFAVAVDAGLRFGGVALERDGETGRILVVSDWLDEPIVLAPADPQRVLEQLGAQVPRLAVDVALTVILEQLYGGQVSVGPLSGLIQDPAGWLLRPEALGDGTLPRAARVNRLLSLLASGAKLETAADRPLVLPGTIVLAAADVTAAGDQPARGRLDLGTADPLVVAETPDGDLTLALSATLDVDEGRHVTPGGGLTLSVPLPSSTGSEPEPREWRRIDITAGSGPDGLRLSVTPQNLDLTLELLPRVRGLPELLEGAVDRLLPEALDELVNGLRAQTPPPVVLDDVLAVATALGVYDETSVDRGFRNRQAQLATLVDDLLTGGLGGAVGPAATAATTLVRRLLGAAHVPPQPTPTSIAVRLPGVLGGAIELSADLGVSPPAVTLSATDLKPGFATMGVAVGYTHPDLTASASVRGSLDTGAGLTLRPRIDVRAGAEGIEAELRPLGSDEVVVPLAPEPAAPTPDQLLLLAEHWLVPLATTMVLRATEEWLDQPLWRGTSTTSRQVLVAADVIDSQLRLKQVPLPPPARLLTSVLGALQGLEARLPRDLRLSVATAGSRFGLRLRGALPIPVGDQKVVFHLGLADEYGMAWGDPGRGLAVFVLDATDATDPKPAGVVRLGGLGVGIERRDGKPLLDLGVFELGSAAAHVHTDVDLIGAGAPRRLTPVRTAVALNDLKLWLQGETGPPTFAGDALVAFSGATFDLNASRLRRDEGGPVPLPIDLKHLHIDDRVVAATWDEPRINHWLEQLAPDLSDAGEPDKHELSLRILLGQPIEEVRFDWVMKGEERTFKLPGVDVTIPDDAQVTLMLGAGGRDLDHVSLCLTYDSKGSENDPKPDPCRSGDPLAAHSTFAWNRGDDRELQQDGEAAADPEAKPLFSLSAAVCEPDPPDPEPRVATLVLVAWDISELGLPQFMRELPKALGALPYGDPDKLAQPTPFEPQSLSPDVWDIAVEINADDFQLPFLRRSEPGAEQFIEVYQPPGSGFTIDFGTQTVALPIGITVGLGADLRLGTQADVKLNWETLALDVDHDKGLELYSHHKQLPEDPPGEFLGLHWTLHGAELPQRPSDDPSKKRYLYFTLQTKNGNYRIQQAPGSTFEVEYTEISEEPIVFAISDFAISAAGLDVTAEVTDRPVRLNAIDTRFRFSGTKLQIVESDIKAFTLHGTGPLPPDLVGEATADIALQFEQRDGALTLREGHAEIKGSKLLQSPPTRFRFSVDKLGLNFVYDGGFHLYFLITGTAEFVPAPDDDPNGPLALLGGIKIDLVDAPLTGDMSVLARHVRFLVTLPKPKSFSFLGAFEMELRAIGFIPQAEVFDGDAAMILTGQLKFAQGVGDAPDSRTDVHTLYLGLPKPGSFIPRIHFTDLPVRLNLGEAFRLNGSVEFLDTPREKGFTGDGVLEIQGLPSIAASFAFLRVRRDESSPWVRAWFIYLEVRKVSFPIPYVQIYLREVGLGFGYRYTLAAIQASDRTNDVRKLLQDLRAISRTQGDLSKRDRWSVDLEEPGEDPRWTVALRALFSQTSASASPLRYEPAAERELACTFLLDAVIALRSDLTFLMAVRGWLSANYHDYVTDAGGIRERPLLSGFALLSPRQKRLLAQVSSNPDGKLGRHPPLPEFVEKALAGAQVSATLLLEPGLLHFELGWPNMLRWGTRLGPLEAEMRGGFIFRISRTEMVLGISYLARARLEVQGGLDLRVVGVKVSASASLAYGARFLAVLAFQDPANRSAMYGAIGLDAQIRVSIELWIRIKLVFATIQKTFRLSAQIAFTAGVEAGLVGASLNAIGVRGSGTFALSAMGRSFRVSMKFGVNEGAVQTALDRTRPFLHVGLEAGDVEGVPGVESRSVAAPADQPALAAIGGGQQLGAGLGAFSAPQFHAPGYEAFVVRPDAAGWTYFVLMPQGERDDASPEPSFLPVPPPDDDDGNNDDSDVVADFGATFTKAAGEDYELQHYNPTTEGSPWKSHAWGAGGRVELTWKARWDALMAEATQHDTENRGAPTTAELRLRDYLRHGFLTDDQSEDVVPIGDPEPLEAAEPLGDARVHDPDDAAVEAAVRGAVEQFRGSPLFKHDPNVEYDRRLEVAFSDDTSVYDDTGTVPKTPTGVAQMQQRQQAIELRDMIVQDLVQDLREYAAAAGPSASPAPPPDSVAFHMGLVFRVKGPKPPAWLERVVDAAAAPALRQRVGPAATEPTSTPAPVRTFNLAATDFARVPPQFRRVQQLTDATTIAFAWDLVWDPAPTGLRTAAQADPDHHLMHYHVRRRPLSGEEQEVVYTVKDASALQRDESKTGGDLYRLKPRFRVVDHFTEETVDDAAALPAGGRSYVYTFTPIDFTGHAGRPLTLVATRFPNEPPRVPADAELVVRYRLKPEDLEQGPPAAPRAVAPQSVSVAWTEPASAREGPAVGIDRYVLVLRKSSTMPIGSYGLDASSQGPRTKRLPTTNARPLPTDVRIELDARDEPGPEERDRVAQVPLDELRSRGVLPSGDPARWRPESWRAFLQTESLNGVPSALAPVQLLLEAVPQTPAGGADPALRREQRRPAELEWLAHPMRFGVLPPEDGRATPGPAHVPMPAPSSMRFDGQLGGLRYDPHPAGLRCIRLRWNQAPSGAAAYPLDLSAGFEVLELDVDAHTTDTFADAAALADALRAVQEVRMVPAEDLLLTPGDTLATSQWEAWYPSFAQRRAPRETDAQGPEPPPSPWHSWRESWLEWPEWPGLTDFGLPRVTALHPFLQAIVDHLEGPSPDGGPPAFVVDAQGSPPLQPGDLAAFLRSTPPKTDPYGWGVLQRLGLSTCVSMRATATGELVAGQALLDAVHEAIEALATDESLASYRRHLHVELLFRPDRNVSLEPTPADPGALLAIIQLSLRPIGVQERHYRVFHVDGPPGARVDLVFNLAGKARRCTVVNQADRSALEIAPPDGAPAGAVQRVRRGVLIGPAGTATLLLRTRSELAQEVEIGLALSAAPKGPLPDAFVEYRADPHQLVVKQALHQMEPSERDMLAAALPEADKPLANIRVSVPAFVPLTDERSAWFTVPEDLADELAAPAAAEPGPDTAGGQWLRLKRYLEALNSTDPDVPADQRIAVPVSAGELAAVLPDVLGWAQRFFDAGGGATFEGPRWVAQPGPGPWQATAYPRVGSPAYVAPDPGGRLTYDHLMEDQWAHAYRYYVRPYGRYDLLWQSLRLSPALFPDVEGVEPPGPDPEAGGLDVVLDRTRPVDAPLVLASTRLDPPAREGAPSVPGATWEVIVAQHPEQALRERNATLARQLAFRQVAFALLRRFAYPSWPTAIEGMAGEGHSVELDLVEDRYPEPPAAFPETPDHVVLDGPLDDDVARTLDLPERLQAFGQGALVLQWEGLPFFYEHRLLLVAQTDSTVSAANEVVQRDFEYRAPEARASAAGEAMAWRPPPPFGQQGPPLQVHARRMRISLGRLWDALPAVARERWADEAPDPPASTKLARRPASLPDPEVTYQLVEVFSGNVEVQCELLYDAKAGAYVARQLGQRLLGDVRGLVPPPASAPQRPYELDVAVQQVSETPLTGTLDLDQVNSETKRKIALDGALLRVAGVLTADDCNNLVAQLAGDDAAAVRRLYRDWYVTERVNEPPALAAELEDLVDFPEADDCVLIWNGPMSAAQRDALGALPGDPVFRDALARIAAAATEAAPGDVFREPVAPGPEQAPSALAGRLSFARDVSGFYVLMRWKGPLYDDALATLRAWARLPALADAVDALERSFEAARVVVAVPAGATLPAAVPALLRDQLEITSQRLSWHGRLRSAAQLQALHALTGDAKFAVARDALIDALTTGEHPVPLRVLGRPRADQLPEELRDDLAIGRTVLRYHGLMTADEARALRAAFEWAPDRLAVERLYAESLGHGMNGRRLMVRALRGSAEPGPAAPIEALGL